MKNSNKILVSALTFAIGAALVGSVSSTIAWYQYSTRAKVKYNGTTFGTTGNLKLRIAGEGNRWETRLTKQAIAKYLEQEGRATSLEPITTGDMRNNGSLNDESFYRNPVQGAGPYSKWKKATKANFVTIPLQLCFASDETDPSAYTAEKVYLTTLDINKTTQASEDISSAVRVHISTDKNYLISNNGGETITYGYLDLDDDGENDMDYPASDPYGTSEGAHKELVTYGDVNSKQDSYKASDLLVDMDPDTYKLVNPTDDKCIGSTVAGNTSYLNVTVTIWVEGWQKLEGKSVWKEKFIDQMFEVGIEFGVDVK